jgi:hypothetical protein
MNASAHFQPIEPDLPLVTDLQSPPWREAFLAGFPHLWLALSLSFGKLVEGSPTGLLTRGVTTFAAASFVVFLGASVLVSLYALLRRFPLWTASWYSYAAWTLVILLGLWTARAGSDNWALTNLLVLGAFGSLLLGYLFIFRHSRLHALLVALFLLPVASQIGLESIPAGWEAVLALVFGALAALVAAFVLRRWEWSTSVALAIGANLLAGLLLVYVAFAETEIAGFYGDSLRDALLAFALYAALTFALFLGPALVWRLIDRLARRRSNP